MDEDRAAKKKGAAGALEIVLHSSMGRRLLLGGILLTGFLLRSLFISAESPYTLCGYMSPWVDEAAYSFAVKDQLLHGSVPSTADEGYYYFLKNTPGHQIIYSIVCKIFGVSYASIRMVSVVLNSLAVWVLFLLIAMHTGRRTAFITVVLLCFSYIGIMYGRLALTHSLVVPLFVFCVYFWNRAQEHPALALFAGFFLSYAYFTNQLAIVFCVIIGLWWLAWFKKNSVQKQFLLLAWFCGGILISGGGVILMHSMDLTANDIYNFLIFNFFKRRSGNSPSLLSLLPRFIEPAQMLFFNRLPVITVAAFCGGIWWLKKTFHRPVTLWGLELLMVIWIVVHLLFLSIFGYRPIRYHFYIMPPVYFFAAVFLGALWGKADISISKRKTNFYFIGIVFGAAWLFFYFIVVNWLRSADLHSPVLPFAGALAVTGTVYLLAYRWQPSQKFTRVLALFLGACILYINVTPYVGWIKNRKYRTVESGRDMAVTVGKDAVLGMLGSLSNAFGLESHLKEVAYGGGVVKFVPEYSIEQMFRMKPVTHMLMRRDKTDYHRAWANIFPEMYREKKLIKTYYYKHFSVDLFRVRHPYTCTVYALTEFECALEFERGHQADSAIAAYQRHLAKYPGHADACYRLGLLISRTNIKVAIGYLEKAEKFMPRSYGVKRNLGALLLAQGQRERTLALWQQAAELFPYDKTLNKDLKYLKAGRKVVPLLYFNSIFL